MTRHEYGLEYSISFHRVNMEDQALLDQFQCENPPILDFIQNKSVTSPKDVSYVFVDDENKRVMGFCSICCTGISINAIDDHGEPYLTSIPAVEIDYFAVDEEYRSMKLDKNSTRYETLSQAFFLYMLDKIKAISIETVGATHICLYAVPEATNFYKRCGFEMFESYMNADEKPFIDGCVPMFHIIEK